MDVNRFGPRINAPQAEMLSRSCYELTYSRLSTEALSRNTDLCTQSNVMIVHKLSVVLRRFARARYFQQDRWLVLMKFLPNLNGQWPSCAQSKL